MNEVKILVDGSSDYVKTKYEKLKEMLNGTDLSVELNVKKVESMSGHTASYYYLIIKKSMCANI